MVDFPTFHNLTNIVYSEGTYWTVNGGGDVPMPRWSSADIRGRNGTRYLYDASFLRLKSAEIAYSFSKDFARKLSMSSFRVFLNGDNLLLWTKMPDDRENNFAAGASSGAYPTVRRFNLGIDITF